MTNANNRVDTSVPLEQWAADMRTAVDEIGTLGSQLLELHRQQSQRAMEAADRWKLHQRLEGERAALESVFTALHRILSAAEKTKRLMDRQDTPAETLASSMRECAEVIESELPAVQDQFLTIRHCALDLLRWIHRFSEADDGGLSGRYRESYGRLLAYTPIFRPRLEAMREDLVRRSRGANVPPELQRILTQLNQYLSAIELARAFIKSVVDPPMELVFHDTESFQQDWTAIDPANQANLATELNDHCQLLLYDTDNFQNAIANVQRPLAEGVDASVYVLPVEDWRVVFTMDEDPVFQQLIVSLLRVVKADKLDATLESLFDDLHRDFSKT